MSSDDRRFSWTAEGADKNGALVQGNPNEATGKGFFDEFSLHLAPAFYPDYPSMVSYVNSYPTAPVSRVPADSDNGGHLSMKEAFNYSKAEDSRSESPQSSGANIGNFYL